MGYRASEGRTERDHRSHVARPLTSHGSRDDTTQTVSDDMDWAASFLKCPIHGLVKMPPYEQIGTLGIQSDAGEVRPVADAAQPRIQLHKIHVGS